MAGTFNISDNQQVVLSLKAGSEEAFKAIYTAYGGVLYNYARSILQQEEAAHEIVQELFIALWFNRKKLDSTKSLRNYLLRATHNNALRRKQSDAARRRREERAAAEQLAHDSTNDDESTGSKQELLAPAIARLPKQSRKVLEMVYWENKKRADIASELSISVRTVETILYKVMKKLHGEIKKN